ncbi:MAG: LysM peptidoglycan-binding domain-containing protein [Chthoniobacterales bacterium]|nr:LysM peptidoglycan-binding domain-containing protein [Chthoniobacterales bacterium]
MKLPSSQRRIHRLRAKAAAADGSAFEDYGQEPNMKLSHAFLVVLALHIIAVGGLFAFNKVKAHHALSTVKIKTENALESSVAGSSEAAPLSAQGAEKKGISSHSPSATAGLLHAAPMEMPANTPSAPPATTMPPLAQTPGGSGIPPTPPPSSSSAIPAVVAPTTPEATPTAATTEYTVVKGDNPYKIAKKFHVSYDSLMKINNITDPRKIQIGQKLQIPAPLPTASHKVPGSPSHQASSTASHKAATSLHKVAKKKTKHSG